MELKTAGVGVGGDFKTTTVLVLELVELEVMCSALHSVIGRL